VLYSPNVTASRTQIIMHLLTSSLLLSTLLLFHVTLGTPVGSTFESKCTALIDNLPTFPNLPATVNIAKFLPANSTIDHTAEGLNATCAAYPSRLALPIPVNICRLQLKVATSEASSTVVEVWLPETWSGRFLSVGNGGFAGCIEYQDLINGVSYGFASAATDNGHEGTSGGAWFHQPEVLKDFVWRSLYSGVVVGKEITKSFYGKEHDKSYFYGCSSGGRQAWKAIQSYPELFDGVIAGAPAFDFTGLIGRAGWALQTLGFNDNTIDAYMTEEDWARVAKIVLEQCDQLDGATDGILEDPNSCHPEFSSLACSKTNNEEWCFSRAQLSALATVFKPLVVNGTTLAMGASYGSELAVLALYLSPIASEWVDDYFKFVVKEDLTWDRKTFTLEDAVEAFNQNPFNIQTFDADISAFRDRGGKVLHWHGSSDPVLPSTTSDWYYQRVSEALKATVEDLDEFYRYFKISGTYHCAGGPGANAIGQGFGMAASDDPDDNLLMRIVEWVENGEAPEIVRGTKFVNDTPELGVAFARKHCKHPKVNKYTGSGNGTDEEGWHCVDAE
jgi:feruloyl esterase